MDDLQSKIYVAWEEFNTQRQQLFADMKNLRPVPGPYEGRYRNAFREIAEYCTQRSLDVRLFIQSVLPIVRSCRSTMTPRDLVKEDVLRQFEQAQAARIAPPPAEEMAQQLTHLKQIMWLNKDTLKTPLDALHSLMFSFSYWFRVFLPEEPDAALLDAFAESAWSELSANRVLRDYLRKLRPATMAALENRIAYFGDTIV